MVEMALQPKDPYPSRVDTVPRMGPRLDPVVYGPAEAGGLTLPAEQIEAYRENGFLFFEDFIRGDILREAQEELDRLRSDPALKGRPEVITEPGCDEVRSIFAIHGISPVMDRLCRHPRILEIVRFLLDDEVYIHQSRINYKRGYDGKEFYWHSDFETWHQEDGMPRMRAVSVSLALSDNSPFNGPVMVIPGSHKHFLSCVGETPKDHYKRSLKKQEYGVPDRGHVARLVEMGGIEGPSGPAGSALFFECNLMHGSNSNITPLPRSNLFTVYNSVQNAVGEPFCGLEPRPEFVATRRIFTPVRPAQGVGG